MLEKKKQTRSADAFIVLLLLALAACASAGEKTQPSVSTGALFAAATAGFATCHLGDLYIDEYTGVTNNDYLLSQASKRCDQDEALASYCVAETFYGLKVDRLSVPKTTQPVFALYLDADLATARAALKRALGSEFRTSAASQQGARPELIKDPADSNRSVLICTKQF